MERKLIRRILQVGGMTCSGCELRIENALKKLEGVIDVKAIYSSSNVCFRGSAGRRMLRGREELIQNSDCSLLFVV